VVTGFKPRRHNGPGNTGTFSTRRSGRVKDGAEATAPSTVHLRMHALHPTRRSRESLSDTSVHRAVPAGFPFHRRRTSCAVAVEASIPSDRPSAGCLKARQRSGASSPEQRPERSGGRARSGEGGRERGFPQRAEGGLTPAAQRGSTWTGSAATGGSEQPADRASSPPTGASDHLINRCAQARLTPPRTGPCLLRRLWGSTEPHAGGTDRDAPKSGDHR
jgi:hypothetical protein